MNLWKITYEVKTSTGVSVSTETYFGSEQNDIDKMVVFMANKYPGYSESKLLKAELIGKLETF
jgi:hypothetical protein